MIIGVMVCMFLLGVFAMCIVAAFVPTTIFPTIGAFAGLGMVVVLAIGPERWESWRESWFTKNNS